LRGIVIRVRMAAVSATCATLLVLLSKFRLFFGIVRINYTGLVLLVIDKLRRQFCITFENWILICGLDFVDIC